VFTYWINVRGLWFPGLENSPFLFLIQYAKMKLILVIQDLKVNFEYYHANSMTKSSNVWDCNMCWGNQKHHLQELLQKMYYHLPHAHTYITIHIQPGLFLRSCFLHVFALMLLENLHHFLNLRNNFWFHTIWHTRSVTMLIFCRRLADSVCHCHAISQE
jgi:hypothetical protein